MKRLRVLFFSHWYPTAENPVAGIFVREHARAAALADEVMVLHGAGPKVGVAGLWQLQEERDPALTAGIPTYRVWHRPKPLPGLTSLLYLWAMLRAASRLRRSGFRPDVLHAHIYEAGVAAVLLGWWWRLPVVISEHASDFPRRRLPRWQVWKARFAFGRAARVLPVSQALQSSIEQYGIRANFEIVPNAVDTECFRPAAFRFSSPSPDQVRFLFVGSLLPVKGLPTLLQALSRLVRDDWRLDIVGDGPQRVEIERLGADLGIIDRIYLHGFRTKAELAAFMQAADIFVLPSLTETFSVVTAEALASGLPVVVTRCGGPEDFVTEDVGYLVEPGDVDALATGLRIVWDRLSSYSATDISNYARRRFASQEVGRLLHHVYASCYSSQPRRKH